jgi:hypothetical protein
MNNVKQLKTICYGVNVTSPTYPIVVNNIIYLFRGKLRCLKNELLKKTPLSSMIVGCLKKVN